jgi:hypothetical protein
MDERQIRAVIVSRAFLDRAELLAADGTVTGRMAAVVLSDLSVETAAKTAVADQALPEKARLDRDPPLPFVLEALVQLWQKRSGETSDVPAVREARRVHDVRNSVQHAGLAPDADQVVDARLRANRFLAWVASAWFGRELETISRALLIQHDDIRAHVQDAEQLLERQEYGAAAERLAIAFELARWEFRAQLSREGSTDLLLFRPTDVSSAVSEVRRGGDDYDGLGRGYRSFERVMRGLAAQVARLNDQVEALSLGARMSDYAWFRQHFPRVSQTVQAGTNVPRFYTAPPTTPMTREICLRGLEFVTTTALHWQEFPLPPLEEDER